MLATAGLRNLLTPLTAFTLAHTITLAAIAFGFEPPVPAWLIEATIAILAGIYLFGITVDVWWVVALIHNPKYAIIVRSAASVAIFCIPMVGACRLSANATSAKSVNIQVS